MFPRRRVASRAFQRTEGWLTNRLGALSVLVIVTILVGAAAGAAVGTTVFAACVGALAALLVVVGGKFAFELARYRLSGWNDPLWEATCESANPGSVIFGLNCKVQPPEPIPHHLECAVKVPSGEVVDVPGFSLYPRRPMGVLFDFAAAQAGSYEVRWYGLSDRRKLYEITRGKF